MRIGSGRWAAILLAALVMGAVSACGDADSPAPTPVTSTPTATPTATPAPPTPTPQTATPTPTPTPVSAADVDVEAFLRSSVEAMEALDGFHFAMDILLEIDAEGAALELPFKLTGDYRAPDSVRGRLEYSVGFLTIESQLVQVGDAVYVTDPMTGVWMTDAAESVPFGSSTIFLGTDVFAQLAAPELVGEVVFGGVSTYRVSGSIPVSVLGPEGEIAAAEIAMEPLLGEIWIGVDDKLIYGMAITGKIGVEDDVMGFFGSSSVSVDLTFSDHGVLVDIEAPEIPAAP